MKVEKVDTNKHKHLGEVQEKRDVLKCLKEELKNEHEEKEQRLKNGGIDAMTEEERKLHFYQKEMEREQAAMEAIVRRLVNGDMEGIDSRQFEILKEDDSFLDEWAK